jgi:hypothetical protein
VTIDRSNRHPRAIANELEAEVGFIHGDSEASCGHSPPVVEEAARSLRTYGQLLNAIRAGIYRDLADEMRAGPLYALLSEADTEGARKLLLDRALRLESTDGNPAK